MILKGNNVDGFLLTDRRIKIVAAMKGKNTDSVLWLYGTPANVQVAGGADGCELAQGVLKCEFYRTSGYPFTSAGTTGEPDGDWGGAEDMACRINVGNYAANTTSYGGMRALRVYCRQYSGGSIANMYGALIDADDRGTAVAGASVATIQTLVVSQRINTICSTKTNILVVEDNSQGTITPTTCAGTAMVVIQSNQPIASGARASGIHFQTTGSGSGWTNAFSFQTAAGKEGFTALVDKSVKGNIDGYIKVYDVATGQTLYLACYDTVPS
jgi:hypothetical protein